MVYGGDGLARLPADERGRGKTVFSPFVLAGEKIEAAITEQKSGFARARATSIEQMSSHRIAPACPYFGSCGGCQYQHADYEHQLEIKKEILRESLRRTAKFELHAEIREHRSPPWHYRNRSRLQIRTRPEFAAGYFKQGSHELQPVRECPISSPLINRGIAAVWQTARGAGAADGIREVEFFADAEDSQMIVEVQCTPEARRAMVRGWAEELRAALPAISGVTAFRKADNGRSDRLVALGSSELTYRTAGQRFQVSTGSFFQTNRFLVDELVEVVTGKCSGDTALDLYAGAGLFSIALACDFRHIVSVESSQTAAKDLQYNLPTNGKALHAVTEPFLSELCADGAATVGTARDWVVSPELVVVDPPRSGLGDRVARLLTKLNAPRVIYVSCDPATLARDLIPMLTAGYRVEELHLVDLFPQTYHLESVVKLAR